MTTRAFVLQLKEHFSQVDWPWVLMALQQDRLVWAALQDPDLVDRALSGMPRDPERWTPAGLALLAWDWAPQAAPGPFLAARAAEVCSTWLNQATRVEMDLANCGLVALGLRQRFCRPDGCEGLVPLLDTPGDAAPTVLACLYGMLPDGPDLLYTLCNATGLELTRMALHALFSNPLPPEKQAATLERLLERLRLPQRLDVLRSLADQHPSLVAGLARHALPSHLVAAQDGPSDAPASAPELPPAPVTTGLNTLLLRAEGLRLTGRTAQAMPLLAQALREARRLQANLAVQLALTAASSPAHGNPAPGNPALGSKSSFTALDGWKQAAQLAPEDLGHRAGVILALLDAGRAAEARSLFPASAYNPGQPSHPALALAAAQLAWHLHQPGPARQAAENALEQALASRNPIRSDNLGPPDFAARLARLLLDLDLPGAAAQAAELGRRDRPGDPELLALLAQARLAAGQPAEALPAAYAAWTSLAEHHPAGTGPDQAKSFPAVQPANIRRLLIASLEALDEWPTALEEHKALLASQALPPAADLENLARCALRAGELSQAAQAARQALLAAPGEAGLYALLGEISQASGDHPTAAGYYQSAVRLEPAQPAYWLALAAAQQQTGQTGLALETLQAAGQAVPADGEVHLALGEALLASGAATQALPALRRAAACLPLATAAARVAPALGQTLCQLGHLEEARHVLEGAYRAHSLDSQEANPVLSYAYAQTTLALGDLATALPILEQLVQADPDSPGPFLDYARGLLQSSPQPEGAERALPLLQRALALTSPGSPGWMEAQALLGEASAAAGRPHEARDAFRAALDGPLARQSAWRTRLALGLGQVTLELGQVEAAIAVLQEAARGEAHHLALQRCLAEAYLAAGLVLDGFQTAQNALQLDPAGVDTLAWFAGFCQHLHQQPEAARLPIEAAAGEALQRALEIAPERSDLILQLGRLQLQQGKTAAARLTLAGLACAASLATPGELFQAAQDLRALGDAASAIVLLERSIALSRTAGAELAGRDAIALIELLPELAAAHQQAGNSTAALEALDQALVIDPGQTPLYRARAALLTEMKRPTQALSCLKTALRLAPEDGELLLQAAALLEEAGDLPGALLHARQAAASTTTPDTLRRTAGGLAAGLAWRLLQPQAALAYLQTALAQPDSEKRSGPAALAGQAASGADEIAWLCLQVELNLEVGKHEAAGRGLAAALQQAPQHPGVLALQACLRAAQDPAGAAAAFEQTRRILSTQAEYDRQTGRLLGQAALALHAWKDGLAILRQQAAGGLSEPLSHFLLGRGLLQRAEYQQLCQALEARGHAPGAEALSEGAQREFEAALQRAAELAATAGPAWGENLLATSDPTGDAPLRIERLHRHGLALFNPGQESATALAELAESAEELAALVLAYAAAGDLTAARAAAGRCTPNPLALAQLALAMAPHDLSQAVLAAGQAAAQLPAQGEPWLAPIIHALLGRLAFSAAMATPEGQDEQAAQEVQAALANLNRALTLWPDEPRWHALAAEVCTHPANPDGQNFLPIARGHLETAARLEPDYAGHYLALGRLHLHTGNLAAALEGLGRACQLDPDQPGAWLALARVQQSAGLREQAAASAERAIARAADPAEALLLRAELALQANNPRGAASRAQAVLRYHPDDPAALHLLALALDSMDRPAEAQAALEKAIPKAAHPLPLELERARLLHRSQGPASGVQALQELAARYPGEAQVLARLAGGLAENGQVEAAIRTARQALQANHGGLAAQDAGHMHFLIGSQMRQAGQLDGAVHHLSASIQAEPGCVDAYLELGRAHLERRQHNQAMQVYQQAIRVAGKDYRPYYQAGLALKESKDYLQAETMLRRAAELAPDDVSIHRLLGAVVALNLVHNRRRA